MSRAAWGRASGAAAVSLVLLYVIVVLTVPGQWLDDEVFGWAQRMQPGHVRAVTSRADRTAIAMAVVPPFVLLVLLGCVRRRWRDLLVAITTVVVSVPMARVLRTTLPRPDHGYSYEVNTMPSTHVVWVTAAVVGIVLLWPWARSSALYLVAGLVVWLACMGNVVGHAHRPADVVASILLVIAVGSAAMAVGQQRTTQVVTDTLQR